MKINKEEAERIIYEGHEDYDEVSRKIIDQRRWSTVILGVYKNNKTEKFYEVQFEKGRTECQYQDPFYSSEVEFHEVELKEVVVKKWVRI